MPSIVKCQTMHSNEPAETSKNYYLRNLYCPFLDCDFAARSTKFFGHAEAITRRSSILPTNIVTANFCKIEPEDNVFFVTTGALIKLKAQFLLWKRFCQNHSEAMVWIRACKLC